MTKIFISYLPIYLSNYGFPKIEKINLKEISLVKTLLICHLQRKPFDRTQLSSIGYNMHFLQIHQFDQHLF